jgi:hypothetical protein
MLNIFGKLILYLLKKKVIPCPHSSNPVVIYEEREQK